MLSKQTFLKTNKTDSSLYVKNNHIIQRPLSTKYSMKPSHSYTKRVLLKSMVSHVPFIRTCALYQVSTKRYYRDQHKYNKQQNRYYNSFTSRFSVEQLYIIGVIAMQGFIMLMILGYNDNAGKRFVSRNLVVSLKNVLEGRVWTLLTSTFVHEDVFSYLFSSLIFYFIGKSIVVGMGLKRFTVFYLLSGIVSNMVYLGWNYFKTENGYPNALYQRESGSRGATNAVMGFSVYIAPMQQWRLYGVIPVRSSVLFGVLVAYSLYKDNQHMNRTGFQVGHLGGAVFGVLSAFALMRMGRIR